MESRLSRKKKNKRQLTGRIYGSQELSVIDEIQKTGSRNKKKKSKIDR